MTTLGEREYVLGMRFGVYMSAEELGQVLSEAIRAAGMTPFGPPLVKQFPTPEGLGGEGELLFQTIGAPVEVFQMLHESGIMANTYVWKDQTGKLHKCTRILLSSCMPIPESYRQFLIRRLGPPQVEGLFAY